MSFRFDVGRAGDPDYMYVAMREARIDDWLAAVEYEGSNVICPLIREFEQLGRI